jgi:ADP-ribosyl-[dinitrogen reductase] hydrolase
MAAVPKLAMQPTEDQDCPLWRPMYEMLRPYHRETGTLCIAALEPYFLSASRPALTANWVAFSHGMVASGYTRLAADGLLDNDAFLSSLAHCLGIYVFSSAAKNWWTKTFTDMKLAIPVAVLRYPVASTEPAKAFKMTDFLANPARMIVQVGTWGRRTLPFLVWNGSAGKLRLSDCLWVRKGILSTRKCSDWVKGILPGPLTETRDGDCADQFRRDLATFVQSCIDSTEKVVAQTHSAFDDLLSKNILFVNLVDASTVKIVMDALVRNCPIFVNRLPALEEVLGKNYPLFYTTEADLQSLMTVDKIKSASIYLSQLDKTVLAPMQFVRDVVTSSIYVSLPLLDRGWLLDKAMGCYHGCVVGNQLPYSGAPGTFMASSNKMYRALPGRSLCSAEALSLYRWPIGSHRDEAEMSLCVAASLSAVPGFSPTDQMDRFVRWMNEGQAGASTGGCINPCEVFCFEGTYLSVHRYLKAKLANFRNEANPYQGITHCSEAGRENDVGPMMRMAPLILWCSSSPDKARRITQSYVELTHGSREVIECALLMLDICLGFLYGKSKQRVLSGERSVDLGTFVTQVKGLAQGSYQMKGPNEIAPTGSAFRSLEAALWALHHTESFSEGMELILSLESGVNQCSTVYGTVAGMLYGLSGIPQSWRRSAEWDRLLSVDALVAPWLG